MKAISTKASVLSSILLLLMVGSSASQTLGQITQNSDGRYFDHVINRRGESRISVFTGIPVIASTEYAFGISRRVTVGVFGGFTPFEEAIGIRVRTVIYEHRKSFRVYYCTPVIFYPQTRKSDSDPWFLIRPNINFEWMPKSNLRYKVGASVIGSSSYEDLFGDPSKSRHSPEIYTAVHAGISLPVALRMSFQAELSYVMKGIHTTSEFYGGPPIILMTGISFTF